MSGEHPKREMDLKVLADLIRSLAEEPESPKSLHIMSSFNAAVRPRQMAVDQVVVALANQMQQPGDRSDAGVRAAVTHWEQTTGATMDAELLADLAKEAMQHVRAQRDRPPPLEDIVGAVEHTDVGYDEHLHLFGLRGTWHRLWGALVLGHKLGYDAHEWTGAIAVLREQFEAQLKRPMTEAEWRALERHAANRIGLGDT
jgi:hypothetical protein